MGNKWELLRWSVEEFYLLEKQISGNSFNSGKAAAYLKIMKTMDDFDKEGSSHKDFMLDPFTSLNKIPLNTSNGKVNVG